MNNEMLEKLKKLGELELRKDAVEAELGQLKKDIKELQPALIKDMDDAAIQNLKMPEFGKFYKEVRPHVSIEDGQVDIAVAWMKENGFGDLVKETVHNKTLSGFVKERLSQNLEIPPGVRAYMETRIILRKS